MDNIPSLVRSSLQAFGNLIHELSDPVQMTTTQSHLARFKLWAGTLGAHRVSGMQSLAYRLRDASAIRSHVISLLEDLQGSLREGNCYCLRTPTYHCNVQIKTQIASSLQVCSLLESSYPAEGERNDDSIDNELAKLLGETDMIAHDNFSNDGNFPPK